MSTSAGPGVVLVGMRGAGKSTVGAALADALGLDFVDTDELIVSRAGMPIAAIFEQSGEAEFRRIEAAVIADLPTHSPCVVAAGGGAVLREDNVDHLRRVGRIVWLRVGAVELARRVREDRATSESRPSLTGRSVDAELAHLLEERTPLYQAVCELAVDGSGPSQDVIARILAAMPADRPS